MVMLIILCSDGLVSEKRWKNRSFGKEREIWENGNGGIGRIRKGGFFPIQEDTLLVTCHFVYSNHIIVS